MTHHPSPEPVPKPLGVSLTELIKESQALRGDVHGAEAARRRAGRVNLALLAVFAVLVAVLLAVTMQNYRLAHRIGETNARMADCTTPGGRCYEESRRRTGTAIADIIRAQIFMAECSRLYPGEAGPTYDRKLEACVTERLAGPELQRPTPNPSGTPSPSPTRGG